jgi:hypothetical protein
MHQLLPSQLSESRHVDVAEALMPMPRHLVVAPTHRQACWLCEFQMEKVQAVLLRLYLHQLNITRFLDLHHTGVDVDLVANLVELADAHNVGRQTRDEVDPVGGPRLTVLVHEHDSPVALNPQHRVIIETHSAEHCHVDLHERRLAPGLVVRHLGV